MICLAALIFAACTSHSNDQTIKVGMELAYPPFEMLNADGQPDGVSVEMAKAFGKYEGRPVEIVNTAFDGLIPALKTGKIDMIISSMTATKERAQSIDFSDSYFSTGLALLISKKSSVQSVDDLKQSGRKIAVKRGTTGFLYAESHFVPEAEILVFDQESAAVLEVTQGKADAFLYDQLSIYKNWKRNETSTRALLQPIDREDWAIGIRKGNDTLRRRVNAFIKQFRSEGGFDRLGEKYLGEMKRQFRELGISFFL